MSSLIGVLLTALFYSLVGWPLTYMLGKISKIERSGIAFLLSNGLSTFVWFLLYRVVGRFNLFTLLLSGLFILAVSCLINHTFGFKYKNLIDPKLTGFDLKLSHLVIALLLTSFLIGSYNPISGWDAITLYDFRGHTIALNHSLKDLTDDSSYMGYPLMISLDHAAVYMLKGISAQGLHSIILMAFIAVVYGRMCKWTNPRLSLLTILFIILNEEIFAHSTVSYVNLAYLVYLVTGLIYIITPVRESKELGFLFAGGLLIGLTTWIRSDVPFWMIGIILILIQGWQLRAKALSLFSVYIVYLMRHTWFHFFIDIQVSSRELNESLSSPTTMNVLKQVSNYLPDTETIKQIQSILPEIIRYLYLNIFSPFRGLWLLTIPIFVIVFKRRDFRLVLLLLAILLSAMMATFGVMLFSTSYSTWNLIGGSAKRMMLFIIPLAIITSIYALHLTGTGKNETK